MCDLINILNVGIGLDIKVHMVMVLFTQTENRD